MHFFLDGVCASSATEIRVLIRNKIWIGFPALNFHPLKKLSFSLSPSSPHSPAGKQVLGTEKPFFSTFSSQTLFLVLAPRTNSKQTGDTVNPQHCAVNPPFTSVSKHFCATSAVLHLHESHDFYGKKKIHLLHPKHGALAPPLARPWEICSLPQRGKWCFLKLQKAAGYSLNWLGLIYSSNRKWSL